MPHSTIPKDNYKVTVVGKGRMTNVEWRIPNVRCRFDIRASLLSRLLLRRFTPSCRLKPMLHCMIIARDYLPAYSLGKMNHERRFEIDGERAADVTDDNEHLCVIWIIQPEGRNLAIGYAYPILWHESARAHDAERHFRPLEALQPGQGRVLRVAQQHPAPAFFHSDQPI